MFESDDGRALHANAVLAQFAGKLTSVRALELGIMGTRRLQPHPQPRDAKFHQFLQPVLANSIRRGEYCESPALAGFFHALQQLHGTLAVQEKILVHDEKLLDLQGRFHVIHYVEKFIPGFEEVHQLTFAAEE
jgi:hypothetical protein